MDQTTRLDSTGLEHQHWIAAACGIIETLTLDPMTGIFCPLVSCLLHTKTGQHPLPPLYMISGTPPRFTQLSWWSPAIDPHFTPNCQGCMIAKPQWDFPRSAGGAQHTSPEWGKCPFTPILEECLIAKPWRDFPKSAEGVLHTSPGKVNPLLYPHWRNA